MRPAPALKILIVDDHAEVRRLLIDCLRDYPVECIECEDGVAAARAYARHQPDWVTMDVEMRSLDGFAATCQIRRLDPQARVVIVTQHGHETFREIARNAGACGFLLKEQLFRLPELLGLRSPAETSTRCQS